MYQFKVSMCIYITTCTVMYVASAQLGHTAIVSVPSLSIMLQLYTLILHCYHEEVLCARRLVGQLMRLSDLSRPSSIQTTKEKVLDVTCCGYVYINTETLHYIPYH